MPIDELVPGDIVQLAAGDMIPADVRLLGAKDLFVNQAALTGESLPVEKIRRTPRAGRVARPARAAQPLLHGHQRRERHRDRPSSSPPARAPTSARMADERRRPARRRPASTSGIDRFTWLMIRFIAVMVPLVFLINGLTKGDWIEAFFFAVAVAVGLTPEMLPMIVTVYLSKGAWRCRARR